MEYEVSTITHSTTIQFNQATIFGLFQSIIRPCHSKRLWLYYEGWNFNSGNYLFTIDTK